MTGGLYDAETLFDWGVLNRVLPPDDLLEKGMKFAHQLASGPTVAHGATKRLVRTYLDHGIAGADAATAEIAGPLFDSQDLKNAVRSFIDDGPGKATFEGR
jgi:enoyl-CoA hydratase